MFNNLISRNDISRIIRKVRRDGLDDLTNRLRPSARERVQQAWHHTQSPPRQWMNVPAVQRRRNRLITGRTETNLRKYTAEHFLPAGRDLTALSLACGTGSNELQWAQTGRFSRIDAIDISASRIAAARANARQANLSDVLHFIEGDARAYEYPPEQYDVVIAEGALHHIQGLDDLAWRLRATLKRSGVLLLNDYVGPARFQWTDRQLELVNGLIAILPSTYRKRWDSNAVKHRFHRPGRLIMRLSDPSEAVESDRILPVLSTHFETVQIKPYGGTLLQLVLDDIAHNFIDESEEVTRLLQICFAIEDFAMESCEVASDFCFAVYRAS